MTVLQQLIMAILLFFGVPVFGCVWVLWWLSVNSLNVTIIKDDEGVLMSRSFRARAKNGQIYPISAFIRWRNKKRLKGVVWDDIKDCFTVTESAPFIGVKKNIKFKDMGEYGLVAWMPPKELDTTNIVTNTRMVKIGAIREEVYESTKSPLTKQEMLIRVLLPMGLIVLAMAMLIFFPKIYDVIIGHSTTAFETARANVFDWLGQNKPVG